MAHGKKCCLGIERVKHSLDEQEVGTTLHERTSGFDIGRHQLIEVDVAHARIVDVRGNRCRAIGGSECPRDKTR